MRPSGSCSSLIVYMLEACCWSCYITQHYMSVKPFRCRSSSCQPKRKSVLLHTDTPEDVRVEDLPPDCKLRLACRALPVNIYSDQARYPRAFISTIAPFFLNTIFRCVNGGRRRGTKQS